MIDKVRTYWEIAKALHPNKPVSLFVVLLTIPLLNKIGARKARKIQVLLRGEIRPFLVRDGADISTLAEVFVQKEYANVLLKDPKQIIDIGAHIGSATLYFAAEFPDAAIVAYEPDPDN